MYKERNTRKANNIIRSVEIYTFPLYFMPVAGAHGVMDSSDSAILAQELEPYLRWAMQCFFMCLAGVVTYNSYALFISSPHKFHSYSPTGWNLEPYPHTPLWIDAARVSNKLRNKKQTLWGDAYTVYWWSWYFTQRRLRNDPLICKLWFLTIGKKS